MVLPFYRTKMILVKVICPLPYMFGFFFFRQDYKIRKDIVVRVHIKSFLSCVFRMYIRYNHFSVSSTVETVNRRDRFDVSSLFKKDLRVVMD